MKPKNSIVEAPKAVEKLENKRISKKKIEESKTVTPDEPAPAEKSDVAFDKLS